jgi:carbon catabolite-derepressing protein kinase
MERKFMTNFCRRGNGSFDSNDSDDDGGPLHVTHHTENVSEQAGKSVRFSARDPAANYKLPADPWVLRVRWRKDGMYPPGTVPPNSTHSSTVDLRRTSVASLSSQGGSIPSQDGYTPITHAAPGENPSDIVVMHLDIQLYEMEPGVYLVDFKCAGYETRDGLLLEEKEVTSPFPFLDLASKLIIQLAEAD